MYLNLRTNTIKFFKNKSKNKIGVNLYDNGLGDNFLAPKPKTQAIKETMDKLISEKLKCVALPKTPSRM